MMQPSAFPDFGQPRRALVGGQGERDVAHVRDRRLHDARDPDADRARLLPARPGARRSARARARRRGRPRSHPSRRRRRSASCAGTRGRGCAARSSAGSTPSCLAAPVHRPLEREVQLRAAEAAVEPARAPVREEDAVVRRDVADAVRAGERAVHPVQRRRLGRTHVRTDVLVDRVAQAEQLAVGCERGLEIRRRGRWRARSRRGARAGPPSSARERRACVRRAPSARRRRRPTT